ncbi:ATP-binding cassette domain-containing protein [Paenibacillus hamazuiensis]|uniref:ATP-binding cassette domain-containing protein n=1 Tax=Paenibacillus hamazuiensis TaxID=2936508 RepID=UPI0023DF2FA6|nr:ATP-binding cassette domain-containing protein [Paenibacillus hamazuiensis]
MIDSLLLDMNEGSKSSVPHSNPGATPVLKMMNISKFYGVTRALHQMNLEIYPGEVIGLVGANGAGKSTLMKIMTGVVQPTEGSVLIDGETMVKFDLRSWLTGMGLPAYIRSFRYVRI